MIHLLGKIPKQKFVVACSGGVDSMAGLDFLLHGKYRPSVAFFDHLTASSKRERDVVENYCWDKNIDFFHRESSVTKAKGESWEEYWRNERYQFLDSFECPVVVCHHLDDVVETWIFSSLNGQSKLIPYRRNNVIRPFLLNPKEKLVKWAERHKVPYTYDICNSANLMRNYIRKDIVPRAKIVNPGIYKMLKKRIIEKEGNSPDPTS